MKNNFLNISVANIYSKPSLKSEVTSQILYGEKFKVLSKKRNWVKIKTSFDNYIGFIKENKFYENFKPSLKISKLKSKIFRKKNNRYTPTDKFLYFGTGIVALNKNRNYVEYKKNKWIRKKDLKKINYIEKNFVKVVKSFLGCKYMWGGKTSNGIDCSALIQIYFYYNRIFFPRDSKDQLKYCRKKVNEKIFEKNIIFWKGHVAYCLNKKNLIHAYGPKKKVVIMDIKQTIRKIFKDTKLKPKYIE